MTTDKAEAERLARRWANGLGADFLPSWIVAEIEALTARDAEAAAKLARVEAALAKWQHEAEGLREDAAVGRMIRELLRLWPKPTEVYISPLRKDPRDETRPKDPDAFQVELNWGDSYTAYQSDTLAGAAKAALDAAGNTNKETL